MKRWRQILRFLAAVQLLPALESGEETLVGGQAVLEGVMMRSPHAWGIAVRKPSGEIVTHSEPLERPSEQHKWMGWPVVRGVMTLGHAMTLGFRALKFSGQCRAGRNPAAATVTTRAKARARIRGRRFEITGWMAGLNMAFSVAFFIFMYKYLPLLATTELKRVNPVFGQQFVFNSGGRADPHRDVPAVCLGSFAVEGHSPRVRVSRRRAQDGVSRSRMAIRSKPRRCRSIRHIIRAAGRAF